ncbi:hypothetical protein F5Y14DRAFT_449818 [Nemania sp. NC0429]|nr:hypothetical protein F5Y14DRAFT_449818 [Nemania sp. NC0429]
MHDQIITYLFLQLPSPLPQQARAQVPSIKEADSLALLYINQGPSPPTRKKMCIQVYLRFEDCSCELQHRGYCHWHQRWAAMRDQRSHRSGRNHLSPHHRHKPCRRDISPYHEIPVDLDKYDEEMNTTDKSNKLNAKDESSTVSSDCSGAKAAKKTKNNKSPPRPLATGCAANFEAFGLEPPSETEAWERY